jgi:predicted GIY-YIG superfamily endonuclease
MFCVYIISAREGKLTYTGMTSDFAKRLRQHNSEIAGGARYTTNYSRGGFLWSPLVVAHNIPKRCLAMQLERTLKHKCSTFRNTNLTHEDRNWIASMGDCLTHRAHRLMIEAMCLQTWTPKKDAEAWREVDKARSIVLEWFELGNPDFDLSIACGETDERFFPPTLQKKKSEGAAAVAPLTGACR